MSLKIENAKKLQWLWEDEHEKEWMETFLRIIDKSGKPIKFNLTDEQEWLLKNIGKLNIVSKSRQLGISTVVICTALTRTHKYRNYNVLISSKDQKSCNEVWAKLKATYRLIPKWLRLKTIKNNRQELEFVNGSRISCVVAGNKDLGRGATYQLVHLSEFAHMENQEMHLNSIIQALGEDSQLIIESTSKGLNYFAELATKAQNGENDFKLFFFNWINGGTLFKSKYKEAVKSYKAKHKGKMITEKDLDDEEKNLLKLGATLEQLVWRRSMVEIIGIDNFHQEYPSTMLESFVTSGANIFNNNKIVNREISIRSQKEKYISKDKLRDLPILLKQHYGKSFFMFKYPSPNTKYYIGCDLSEGLGKDYSVVEVFSEEGEQVAEFYNNKLQPYKMSEIINEIGRYYNKGILIVEKASGGHSVIEDLRYTYKYMNMMKHKTYDERGKRKTKIGFDTNGKTKGLIINNFRELFEKDEICIHSLRVLEEMKIFEMKDNGTMGNSGNGHDDSVMATALALEGLKQGVYYAW